MSSDVMNSKSNESFNKPDSSLEKRTSGQSRPQKGKKITVSEGLYTIFEKLEKTLKLRGRDVSFMDFSAAIETKITEKMIEEFVEAHTPLDYRLKEATLDPSKCEALEKFLRKLDKSAPHTAEE